MIRNSNFWALEVAKICAHDLTRIPNKEEKQQQLQLFSKNILFHENKVYLKHIGPT